MRSCCQIHKPTIQNSIFSRIFLLRSCIGPVDGPKMYRHSQMESDSMNRWRWHGWKTIIGTNRSFQTSFHFDDGHSSLGRMMKDESPLTGLKPKQLKEDSCISKMPIFQSEPSTYNTEWYSSLPCEQVSCTNPNNAVNNNIFELTHTHQTASGNYQSERKLPLVTTWECFI